MIRMKVYRNARNTRSDLARIIGSIWDNNGNVIYKDAAGVVIESTRSIINSFLLVQNAFADRLNVKIHTIELFFSKEKFQIDKVVFVVQNTLNYFGMNYQCFVVVEECVDGYHAVFGINACSYNGARKVVDNNKAYINLGKMILMLTGEEVRFVYDQTVLFTDQSNKVNNYVSVSDV